MPKKPKFDFNEIVITKLDDYQYANNKIAFVDGMVQLDDGSWNYGVFIEYLQEGWSVSEDQIISTGGFVPKGYNMAGESISVIVTKDGEGMLKEDYLKEKAKEEK